MIGDWDTMDPQARRWIGRGLVVGGLVAAIALGYAAFTGRFSGLGSRSYASDESGVGVYDTDRYRVYRLGGGAEVVRPRRRDGTLGRDVFDLFDDDWNHQDVGDRPRGPHGHRMGADSVMTVRDLDTGEARTVSDRRRNIRP